MESKKPDWERIQIVIDRTIEANPHNPYAELDQAHRDEALRELARAVLLRKANNASASN